jgi:hypothetical protein
VLYESGEERLPRLGDSALDELLKRPLIERQALRIHDAILVHAIFDVSDG